MSELNNTLPDPPQHSKVRTFTPQPDGSIVINTESYYEDLSSVGQEIMRHYKTSARDIVADVIKCLDVFKHGGTHKLTIEISTDVDRMPTQITQTYMTNKEVFAKRYKRSAH